MIGIENLLMIEIESFVSFKSFNLSKEVKRREEKKIE